MIARVLYGQARASVRLGPVRKLELIPFPCSASTCTVPQLFWLATVHHLQAQPRWTAAAALQLRRQELGLEPRVRHHRHQCWHRRGRRGGPGLLPPARHAFLRRTAVDQTAVWLRARLASTVRASKNRIESATRCFEMIGYSTLTEVRCAGRGQSTTVYFAVGAETGLAVGLATGAGSSMASPEICALAGESPHRSFFFQGRSWARPALAQFSDGSRATIRARTSSLEPRASALAALRRVSYSKKSPQDFADGCQLPCVH